MKAKKFVLKQRPEGSIVPSNFDLVDEEIPDNIEEGGMKAFPCLAKETIPNPIKFQILTCMVLEILCQALWLSVDPYMRGAANRINLGDTMPGVQVAM
jgi:NADPH-dependent curcumin reductase CurA